MPGDAQAILYVLSEAELPLLIRFLSKLQIPGEHNRIPQ